MGIVYTGYDEMLNSQIGSNTLLIFEPGEKHTVRAADEELVFVGFLHGAPGARTGKRGGELERRRK
ncbi:MAG TPA: hypothetical protein VJ793_27690 [Anaerolineae bacterium]|nr:hypothetical protein [Anaerolineae bacterium]